jgi:hypothetical protein
MCSTAVSDPHLGYSLAQLVRLPVGFRHWLTLRSTDVVLSTHLTGAAMMKHTTCCAALGFTCEPFCADALGMPEIPVKAALSSVRRSRPRQVRFLPASAWRCGHRDCTNRVSNSRFDTLLSIARLVVGQTGSCGFCVMLPMGLFNPVVSQHGIDGQADAETSVCPLIICRSSCQMMS